MEVRRELIVACTAEQLFEHVDDLALYPSWMQLVHEVDEAEPGDDGFPAWNVELRARVGPLARSKKLRMVRTVHDPPRSAVFERGELDGRSHASWILRAQLDESQARPNETVLTMTLTYGGSLWTGAVLQRVLEDEITQGSASLEALVVASPKR